mmetsp:Transcript_29168/g.73389  ORF Transcript_29168/g.73389 Transcript_29168/m.73389 type:complete len:719 (+) Transcript_29168:237-2393(+)
MPPAGKAGKRAAAKKGTAKQAPEPPVATDKRKHTDMMKKRRRRGMTNELVKQLQELLPPVTWTRCMHETLCETAKEMKRVLSKGSASSPSPPSKKAKTGGAAAAAAPPAEVDGQTLRMGMLLSTGHLRVAIVTDKLEVLDASASFASMFLGRPVANAGELHRNSLSELLGQSEAHNITSAMKYITTATLDLEKYRRVTVGLTVKHANGKSSMFPIEIVPVPHGDGKQNAFMAIPIAPKEEQAGTVVGCVQTLVDKLGGEMVFDIEDGSKCFNWCMSHEVDSKGDACTNPVSVEMDPSMIMMRQIHRMVCDGTMMEFDAYMKSHHSAVTTLWQRIREGLHLETWDLDKCKKEPMMQFSQRVIRESIGECTGLWRVLKGNIACFQCRMNGVPWFETWMSQPVKTDYARMTMTSLALLYPGTLENGVHAIGLEDGSIWWYMPEPMALPAKVGGMKFQWSAILKVDYGKGTASVSKTSLLGDQVSHMTRNMRKAPSRNDTVGDFPLFCHFLGVMERWSPTMPPDHLKVSRFGTPSTSTSRAESLEPQTVLANGQLTLPSPWEASSFPLPSVSDSMGSRPPSRLSTSSSGSMELACVLNSSAPFGFGDFSRNDSGLSALGSIQGMLGIGAIGGDAHPLTKGTTGSEILTGTPLGTLTPQAAASAHGSFAGAAHRLATPSATVLSEEDLFALLAPRQQHLAVLQEPPKAGAAPQGLGLDIQRHT